MVYSQAFDVIITRNDRRFGLDIVEYQTFAFEMPSTKITNSPSTTQPRPVNLPSSTSISHSTFNLRRTKEVYIALPGLAV